MKALLLIALLLQTSAAPTYKISGRVVTLRDTTPTTTLTLRIYGQMGPGNTMVLKSIPVKNDATFEVTGVNAGEYSISIGDPLQSASRNFMIRDSDVTDLEMKVPVPVPVRIVLSDGKPYLAGGISLSLTSPVAATNINRAALKVMKSQSPRDWASNFTLPVYPGDNAISISGVPAGYTVQSITYDGQDVQRNGLRLDAAPTSTIVITVTRP